MWVHVMFDGGPRKQPLSVPCVACGLDEEAGATHISDKHTWLAMLPNDFVLLLLATCHSSTEAVVEPARAAGNASSSDSGNPSESTLEGWRNHGSSIYDSGGVDFRLWEPFDF